MPRQCSLFALLLVVAATSALSAQDAPLPPLEAAERMTVPDGFHVTLFAGEPDVVQPIAIAFDDRGRLWVVECLSYPEWITEGQGHDRVVIFEDLDADGRFDKRTVFWDQGTNLSSIELGFGGVYLCSVPNLIFLPDRDSDDVPDGPPEVLLDGWDLNARHNVVNGLCWGPEGWLYGLNGILSLSRVGPPGAADADRVPLNCGVWRFHPVSRRFEVVAHGTTNPWGLDFDEHGGMFITNCVIKHAFHIVPGGRYQRMFGQDMHAYAFGLLPSCADHIHWAGGYWDTEGVDKPTNDAFGGGHAHSGAMIYLGDNWPAEFRNALLTCNIHGRRVNRDRLDRLGSGYVARHEPDPVRSADTWFRGLALRYGPDGGVYLVDWSDTGECHDAEEVERGNGRIFKITYGTIRKRRLDVARLADERLVEMQRQSNEWFVRHSRRVLAERADLGTLAEGTRSRLARLLADDPEPLVRLRAAWTLHATGGLAESMTNVLESPDEYLRAWGVRLELEDGAASPALLERLGEMAREDASPLVRLHLAEGLQRLAVEMRADIAMGLASRAEDANDPNLPLVIWYGIEPLVAADDRAALAILSAAQIPLVRTHIGRRLGLKESLTGIVQAFDSANDPVLWRDVLTGVRKALHGRRGIAMPNGWEQVAHKLSAGDDAGIRQDVLALSVQFGDDHAVDVLRKLAFDPRADVEARKGALDVLVHERVSGLPPQLHQLLDDEQLRPQAIRGLAAFDDPQTPSLILDRYASLPEADRADAVATLASRPEFALALLAAIDGGRVGRNDLSPFTARQLLAMNDSRVSDLLSKVWGEVRPPAENKAAALAHYKGILSGGSVEQADRSHGALLFVRHCASCHVLFGAGGRIGPDLTGAQRMNADYVLENLLDPSAVVPRDYQVTLIETVDGRIITGIVLEENDASLTLQTASDRVVLTKSDVETRESSPLSMMPEGLLDRLTETELRDLVAYLASPVQVPLPEGAETKLPPFQRGD